MWVGEFCASAAVPEALLEELLELCVEDGVYDGVEGTVDVTQPGDSAHQTWRDGAREAHGSHGVDDKERSPAEQEATCRKISKGRVVGYDKSLFAPAANGG